MQCQFKLLALHDYYTYSRVVSWKSHTHACTRKYGKAIPVVRALGAGCYRSGARIMNHGASEITKELHLAP